MLQPVRRIVTGHRDGRSVIESDEPAQVSSTVAARPGYVVSNLWVTRPCEAAGAPDSSSVHVGISPPREGTVLRVIDFPPEPRDPAERQRVFNATFQSLFRDADHRGEKIGHPGMHVTCTVDYAIVLKGEIYAVMDDEETLLKAGSILIQRGTNHGWSNRSDATARICFVLIDRPA